MAATPGWVEHRLDELFAALPQSPEIASARRAYSGCLATNKVPAAPSDLLGAEFAPCRPALHHALRAAGVETGAVAVLEAGLEALEAEIAAGS